MWRVEKKGGGRESVAEWLLRLNLLQKVKCSNHSAA